MKKFILSLSVVFATGSLVAQQVVDSVNMTPSYANQIWYSMADGEISDAPKDEWDIAFQIQGFGSGILANTQKGDFAVYRTPYAVADWANIDTSGANGISSWEELHNSVEVWGDGAFNSSEVDAFDIGWGQYNQITHVVSGDSCYVIQLDANDYRKIRIDQLTSGVYTFTFADLDGQNEVTATVDKANYQGKNFAYYSIINEQAIDREPLSEEWDLTFVKYVGFIPAPYGVTGVLQNDSIGVVDIDGTPVNDADYDGETFMSEINTIGYDWKDFNMSTFQWELDMDRTFFIKDREGSIWKLHFTDFEGSSSGKVKFTKEQVAFASIGEEATIAANIYPNPLTGNLLHIVLDSEISNAEVNMKLMDLTGKVVYQTVINGNSGLQVQQVNIPAVKAGMYQVILKHNGQITTQKLMIK